MQASTRTQSADVAPEVSEFGSDAAPRYSRARITGIIWLLYFVIASVGLALMRGVVVAGDAVATSNNLLTHATAFQLGGSLDLLGNCLYIVLTVLLYGVFRPLNRNMALLAATFSLMGCATQIIGTFFRITPFVLLTDNQPFGAFTALQLQAAALISLRMFSRVFNVSFALFGCFELVLGYLIFKSTFLPRWLGWLWMIAGVVGLTFLWPALGARIFPLVVAFSIGELILAIWLIVKGPAIDKWEEPLGAP
jgi:Domain of unknown function (DUF4386)